MKSIHHLYKCLASVIKKECNAENKDGIFQQPFFFPGYNFSYLFNAEKKDGERIQSPEERIVLRERIQNQVIRDPNCNAETCKENVFFPASGIP
jgi:hypothetical protein